MSQSEPLELSKPPSYQETKSNPAATLSWLNSVLSTIYKAARTSHEVPTLTRDSYLSLYSADHDFGVVTRHTTKPPNSQSLYESLEYEIRLHCVELRKTHLAPAPEVDAVPAARKLLTCYLSQHESFARLATLIAHLLRNSERHWVQREISEQRSMSIEQQQRRTRMQDRGNSQHQTGTPPPRRKWVVPFKELHTQVWKEEILAVREAEDPDVASEIAHALVLVQQNDGEDDESGESDKGLAKRFSDSLIAIGVDTDAICERQVFSA